MKLIHLATATAAVALLGGAAFAQQPADQTPPAPEAAPPASTDTSSTTTTSTDASTGVTTSATTSTDVAAAPTGAATNASFTNMTVTNGPVPDTKENRAKYGQPLSRAGKMTSARGN